MRPCRQVLSMLQAVGQRPQRQRLRPSDRFFSRLAIGQHSRQLRDLTDPPPDHFLLRFDCQLPFLISQTNPGPLSYPFVNTPSRFSSTLATTVHAACSAASEPAGSVPSGSVASFIAAR